MKIASRMTRRIRPLVMVILWLFSAIAVADVAIPPLKSRITDLTQTLSQREIAQLEQTLAAFEAKKGSQVAVLIVPSTRPETIEQYSIRVAEAWRLGRKGVDDGVLLLVAKQDKTLRIEVGYGLEGVLPDAIARRIIDEIIVPAFIRHDFFAGIQSGVEQIVRVIEGEQLPPPSKHGREATTALDRVLDNIIPIMLVFLVLGRMLQTVFGRIVGATVTGTIAGSIIWLILSSLAIALVIAIIVFIISLFENAGRGFYRGGHSHWSGGGIGGGGSFGGGFSGGGGGFGGGGASGRW